MTAGTRGVSVLTNLNAISRDESQRMGAAEALRFRGFAGLGEAVAAAAGAGDVGVFDGEASAHQPFLEVKR